MKRDSTPIAEENKLTAERVFSVIDHTFFDSTEVDTVKIAEGKSPEEMLELVGVTCNFGVSKKRLEEVREAVKQLIAQLPTGVFEEVNPNGISILQLTSNAYGNVWGELTDAENLIVLAIGLGYAKYTMPEELWAAEPGGYPRVVINLDGVKDTYEKR